MMSPLGDLAAEMKRLQHDTDYDDEEDGTYG